MALTEIAAGGGAVSSKTSQPNPLSFRSQLYRRGNLLAAGSETADSSRENAALRNDNPLGIFKLHHYLRPSFLASYRSFVQS
jgi:hypothetical protein